MKVKALCDIHKGIKSIVKGTVFDLDTKTAEAWAQDRLVAEYDAAAEKRAEKDAAKAEKEAAKEQEKEEKEKQKEEDDEE